MRTRPFLALLPLLAAGCGGPLFSVGAKAQRLCIRQSGEQVDLSALPELPPIPNLPKVRVSGSIHRAFDVDTGDLPDLQGDGVEASLGLQSFRLTAPELMLGLTSLRVALVPPAGSTLPVIVLVQAGADDLAPDGVAVDLSTSGQDLAGYLRDGRLTVQLDADATIDFDPSLPLPRRTATVAVELCTSADASFDYGKQLGL